MATGNIAFNADGSVHGSQKYILGTVFEAETCY
jgi:hypothetical protein